jgi:peptidoglycan/LPS O-acetylase OafA/YrhL
MTQILSTDTLKTKEHFEILDGLRGIAAIAIVIFHFMEIVYPDFTVNFIAHGFLAVDFFFCLSGFVIAYAYDDRIGKMGFANFFKLRLIRLHPLVILGSVLGLLGFLFNPFDIQAGIYDKGKLFLIFLSSLFLIPFPVMPERFFNLFSLNAPAWSLFWEYVANIFYALILYKITRRYLLLLTILAAAALFYVNYTAGNLLGGWSGETFWHGFVRISYSFLAGLLIYRSNWIIKSNLRFISLAALLILAFLMPYTSWNWITESIIVLFYFPLLIAVGAGATLKERFKKLCVFSGKISYPLYMTHYAAIWIFGSYYSSKQPGGTQLFLIISLGTLLLVGFAYLTMVFYDIPVRKYLTHLNLSYRNKASKK